MTVTPHTEDQYLAAWCEHAMPGLVEVYKAVRKETSDEDFAADVICWAIAGGGHSADGIDSGTLETNSALLRDAIAPTIVSVYKRAIENGIAARKARRVAMAFTVSRWRFKDPGECE